MTIDELADLKKTRSRRGSGLQSPLETYLREINETALLTADEEKSLARAIAVGDARARDRMVRANLRLVVNIARGYTGKGLGLQDLIEEGNLGLLRAVEGFDPDMGTRFSTSKWRRASVRLTDELKRNPTPEEVARLLGLPKRKLPIIKKAIQIYNSTPQTDQSDSGWSLGELVMDDRSRSPAQELLESDTMEQVQIETEALKRLGDGLRDPRDMEMIMPF